MAQPSQPSQPRTHIGIFDSGIGGLSVLGAVQRLLPRAHCSYLADTRHTPWGDRPAGWVSQRCEQLAAWLIDHGADLVLVACNTGTTQAIAQLRQRWPQRLFVGVEPGIKPAVASSRNRRVAVMATTGTLRSARLDALVDAHATAATVLRLPCPGLVDAIEQSVFDDAPLRQRLDDIAAELRAADVDTVVLGCTHYPLVADLLRVRLGAGVALVDTAEAVARRVASLLPGAEADIDASGLGDAGRPVRQLLATGETGLLAAAVRRWVSPDASVQAIRLPDPDARGTHV